MSSRYVSRLGNREKIMRYAIALPAMLMALALSGPVQAQSTMQPGKYCLTGAAGTAANCSFQTMAACEKAKSGQPGKCMPNSMTTGSGSGMKDQKKQ